MQSKTCLSFLFMLVVLLTSCRKLVEDPRMCEYEVEEQKMRGANCSETRAMRPWTFPNMAWEWHTDWVALIPQAYVTQGDPTLMDTAWADDLSVIIPHIQNFGYKIMLKPHVDVNRSTIHRGEYELENDSAWTEFETAYRQWTLDLAKIARDYQVEMFCVGTELRIFTMERPKFWQNLIEEVRGIYTGPLTYAANWDEYGMMPFWDQLDYIGIDGYFPLVEARTPEVEDLVAAWEPDHDHLYNMHLSHCKPILFTEIGYRSVDYAAWEHWNITNNVLNWQVQANGFEAFYRTFWHEDWVAGAFVWDWRTYPIDPSNTEWTPQDKPAAEVIKDWHGR
ncbi:MAG: hypothetical protein AAF570_22545 [Bacteroidota bacterium]